MENLENIQNIPDMPETLDENSEASEPRQPAEADNQTAADIDRLIAEAEQRGYIRGCKDHAAEMAAKAAATDDIVSEESCPGFLAHLRPDFWD